MFRKFVDLYYAHERAEFFKARAEAAEARLFAEIDSNRLREDEILSNFLLTASSQQARLPGKRQGLSPADGPAAAVQPDQSTVAYLEQAARIKAEQFAEAAEMRGEPYTESDLELMFNTIMADPTQYDIYTN